MPMRWDLDQDKPLSVVFWEQRARVRRMLHPPPAASGPTQWQLEIRGVVPSQVALDGPPVRIQRQDEES